MGASSNESLSSDGNASSTTGASEASSLQLQPEHSQLDPSEPHQHAAAAASVGQSLSEQHWIHLVPTHLVSESTASRHTRPAAPYATTNAAEASSMAHSQHASQRAPKDNGQLDSASALQWLAWIGRLQRNLPLMWSSAKSSRHVFYSSKAADKLRTHSWYPFVRPSRPAVHAGQADSAAAAPTATAELSSAAKSLTAMNEGRVQQEQRMSSFPRLNGNEHDARLQLRDADERTRPVVCKGSTLRSQACQGASTSSWSGTM